SSIRVSSSIICSSSSRNRSETRTQASEARWRGPDPMKPSHHDYRRIQRLLLDCGLCGYLCEMVNAHYHGDARPKARAMIDTVMDELEYSALNYTRVRAEVRYVLKHQCKGFLRSVECWDQNRQMQRRWHTREWQSRQAQQWNARAAAWWRQRRQQQEQEGEDL